MFSHHNYGASQIISAFVIGIATTKRKHGAGTAALMHGRGLDTPATEVVILN